MHKIKNNPHILFTAMFAVVIILTLFVPSVCSMPDIGDYFERFSKIGIYTTDKNYVYAIGDLSSPNSFFDKIIFYIMSFHKNVLNFDFFDIRILGIFYSIIFVGSMFFLMKNAAFENKSLKLAFCAVLFVIFSDLGYISYFNSLHSEAISFAAVILMCCIALSAARKPAISKIITFFICAMVFSFARYVNLIITIFIAIGLLFAFLNKENKIRITSVLCALVLIASSAFSLAFLPNSSKTNNATYNSIFYGALLNSQKPESDLAYFGLDGFSENIGIPSFQAEQQVIDKAAQVPYFRVLSYYAKNPSTFLNEMKFAVNNSYFLAPEYVNYNSAYSFNLRIWSSAKRYIPQGIWVCLAFMIAFLSVCISNVKRKDKSSSVYALAAVLPVCAFLEMVSAFIIYGHAMISIRLFMYSVYFDLMLILAVAWAIKIGFERRENIKQKYGVNQ